MHIQTAVAVQYINTVVQQLDALDFAIVMKTIERIIETVLMIVITPFVLLDVLIHRAFKIETPFYKHYKKKKEQEDKEWEEHVKTVQAELDRQHSNS